MKWGDKDHADNNPSSKQFDKAAYSENLCPLSEGIDHEKYANHDKVNWDKFQSSPAFTHVTEDQQKCLIKAHEDGNGADGLVGYEILYCGIDKD